MKIEQTIALDYRFLSFSFCSIFKIKELSYIMKRIVFILSLMIGCVSYLLAETSYDIPLAGNAYEIGGKGRRSAVSSQGAWISSSNPNKVRVYFKLFGNGNIRVKMKGEAREKAELQVTFAGKTKKISFSEVEKEVSLGSYVVKHAGHQYVELSAISGVVLITNLLVEGEATEQGMLYVNSSDYYYWGRRGPSCHLAFSVPTQEPVTYYYNEVLVPKGQDVRGSYFMAIGFGEGYFGIQVNSETERRILFSVWSPYQTDDPKSIPQDQRIVLNKKGEDVYTGEFGNEGSGGQSYLRYNWKSEVTYKFLLQGKPDGSGNTDYTAWFFDPETSSWRLIASFKRPKTDTYLRGFHSFLENFDPNQGYLTRQVFFKNQWVYDGSWKKVEAAKLTVDATYRAKQREDATGGVGKEGFFLKMGGFFDEIEMPNTVFKLENKSTAPTIDFNRLP